MIERLTRLCLAFAVAFVFAGQMEAAAAHCVRLAQADVSVAIETPGATETASCHGDGEEMSAPQPGHHKQAPHHKAGERCECVAVLTACAEVAAAGGSSHIQPYEWKRPEAAAFASIEPSPALKPPRA